MLPKEIKILCSPVTLTYGRALLESDLIVMQDRPDPVPGILTYFPENIFDTVLEAVSSAYRNAMGFFTYDLIQSLPNRASTFLPYSSILLLIGTIFLLQLK